ncbi:hypothetical protein [Leptolyngbya phage Lbo240-yong1]|uniref:Uncharacterized protein n=1 Tax=Leptolyngbya phage Lbo240-yong1 TaxID=2928836 RepID=A0A9X9E5F1_9CAUD|nr:hypothetical protein [Leptolyngbya phage Lbo240-yong1]
MTNFFPDGFQPDTPRTTLRIALRRNQSDGGKRQPVLKGYVLVRVEQARQILAACEAESDNAVFLNVALWDDQTDPKYPLTGSVSTSHFNPNAEAEKLERKDLPKSVWY